MTWNPRYTITPKLLSTIRKIGEEIGMIRASNLPHSAQQELRLYARQLSTHASTSIEGNPLALTDVRRLLKNQPKQIRDTEREILNYNQALEEVYAKLKSDTFALNRKTIEELQGRVVKDLLDNPKHIGKYRKAPVVISDPRRADGILFIPPDAKDVPVLMTDLMAFINKQIEQLDAIILAGLFHRQHLIIHPFMDGNGRTTRLLTTAILGLGGLDIFDLFAFEDFYNRNVTRYFKNVGAFGDYYEEIDNIDHTQWLEYFAEGLLDELIRVRAQLKRTQKMRIEPHYQVVLDYLDEHGQITQREYGDISDRSLASRKNDLSEMVKQGLIVRKGKGRSVRYELSSLKY